MNELPIIRLELDQMRMSILHAFADYQGEISKVVTERLDSVIKNFDFKDTIDNIAFEVLKDSINDYFKYGEGRKIIELSLKDALSKVLGKG